MGSSAQQNVAMLHFYTSFLNFLSALVTPKGKDLLRDRMHFIGANDIVWRGEKRDMLLSTPVSL